MRAIRDTAAGRPSIKVGLCGWTVGIDEYFEKYPLVEVQQTFYQPPTVSTLARWRERAPAGFEFTMKAWQLITHEASSRTYARLRRPLTPTERGEAGAFRWTPIVREAWATTTACAATLRATSVLFQCPRSFKPTPENLARMRRFFRETDRQGLRFVWEPRGAWPSELVGSLCEELDLVHAVDPFVDASVTPGLLYFRLHGIGSHRHVYSDAELQTIAAAARRAPVAYVLFNNIPRDRDAERFLRL